MKYKHEIEFMINTMRAAFEKFGGARMNTAQKSAFDLVTDIDLNIEKYITAAIQAEFPHDRIHGEEFSSDRRVAGRTWTVDPIDGTCNMANGSKLFGMQCALIADGEIVVGAVYLPHLGETIYASKGDGCYFNGKRISVKDVRVNNAIVSFGDYPHDNDNGLADVQHDAIKKLFPQIAKIRMFGAACMDFSFVAQGRTHGTVLFTKNLWDIAPGIVICREAGAIVTNLKGKPYKIGDDGVVAAANDELSALIRDCLAGNYKIEVGGATRTFDACIFDFDGVIADTEKFHYAAWKHAFSAYGVDMTADDYLPLRSTGKSNIIGFAERKRGAAFTDGQRARIAELKDAEFKKLSANVSDGDLIRGAREFLARVNSARVKTGVASSAKSTANMIDALGLQNEFDAVIDGNADIPKKPLPDIYLAVMKKLGVAPERCLVFEDSAAGIQAAVSSGASVIAVGGIKDERALVCVNDFAELID